MKKPSICIIGLGYIGLPTAALLANRDYSVIGVDIQEDVVQTINQGKIHIVEPELDTFVRAAVESGRLKAFTKPSQADVFMICVPTPFHHSNHSENASNEKNIPTPNLDYVLAACHNIAPFLKPGNLVILESTSPVGTTEKIRDTLKQLNCPVEELFIAYCPERVLPGKIMHELVQNDRIVGGINLQSTQKVSEFYKSFVSGEVLETDCNTAEMCKLVENSSRDVNIAFANELSILCDNLNINVWELIRLANHHPRVKILQPGPGVGGHCIAVDPWFIVSKDPTNARLIQTARSVNLSKTEWVIKKTEQMFREFEKTYQKKPKIACFGLAFKPDIDDLRESPSLDIYLRLKKSFDTVFAVEPHIHNHPYVQLISTEDALKSADIILFLVKHKEFIKIKNQISDQILILDTCGVLE